MAIVDQHIDSAGLGPFVHNVFVQYIASAKVSITGAILTRASVFSASSINSTAAAGTQPDYARNLVYQASVIGGTASSAILSAGSVIVVGSDIVGNAMTESIAATRLAQASVPIIGTALFGSIGTVSFNVLLHTGSSTNSSCVSLSIGVGNIIGLPQAIRGTVQNSTTLVAYIGTLRQGASVTLVSGPLGTAGVSFSNVLATNTPIQVLFNMRR